MGFQAGLLDIPVRRPALVETTALGAAGLAGLATGIWSSGDEFLAAVGDPSIFEGAMAEGDRRALRAGWARAVNAARGWAAGHRG